MNKFEKKEFALDVNVVELLASKDGGSQKAKIVIVKSGWNLNNIYIEDSVLDDLVLAIPKKPKLFMNHDMYAWLGRDTKDWAASFLKVWKEGEEVLGEIEFTSNPNTSWLHGELKKNPSAVQFSIHVVGLMVDFDDKEQDRHGVKMEKLQLYRSTDIVTYAAAGGKGVEVLNSILEQQLNNFKSFINKEEINVDPIKNAQELKTVYPGFVTEILNSEVNPIQLNLTATETKLVEAQAAFSALETKSNEAVESIKELTASIETLKKERDEYKLKVDEVEVIAAKEVWNGKIQKEITDSKIDKEAVTPVFLSMLQKVKVDDLKVVKELINDRKTIYASASGVINNGGAATTTEEGKGNKEVKLSSDDEIINGIKS